tara:strand:- start:787 stop:924 length:138 start_codon:yes stop_codon:yes gene_type:complete
MYVVYEEHIETLEAENEELKQEVLVLKQKLKYYRIGIDTDISSDI